MASGMHEGLESDNTKASFLVMHSLEGCLDLSGMLGLTDSCRSADALVQRVRRAAFVEFCVKCLSDSATASMALDALQEVSLQGQCVPNDLRRETVAAAGKANMHSFR